MKWIQTKNGDVCVDDDIYAQIQKIGGSIYWHTSTNRYNYTYVENGKAVNKTLTSFITGKSGKEAQVGFLDGDTRNCVRSNLVSGRAVRKHKAKKYHGVNVNNGNYQARIPKQGCKDSTGSVNTVGTYKEELVAAIAYNKAMDRVYGAGNFIKNEPDIPKDLYAKIYQEVEVDLTERNTRQGLNKKLSGATSKYTGVSRSLDKGIWKGKWSVYISFKAQSFYLGRYDSEVLAAQAYNQAALYLYGPDAKQNDVPKPMHTIIDIEKIKLKLASRQKN